MEVLFQNKIVWPSGSIIKINTIDNETFILHRPILNHRWPLFRDNPDQAIEIIKSLKKEELQAILRYVYSDLPVKRSFVPIFRKCKLTHPQSLQDSTFIEDMRGLMKDSETADFILKSDDPQGLIPVHRVVLATRSKYFRSMFLSQSQEFFSSTWECFRPISFQTLKDFVEYLYTGQVLSPSAINIIPFCWIAKYLSISGDKEVENILVSTLTRELNAENEMSFLKTAQEWDAKCVIDIIEKFDATK